MSLPVKAWLRFYFKLSLVAGWNGVLRFLYVLTSAGVLQGTQTVDFRTIGWAGTGWVLFGTMLASIAGAWYRHPLPEPSEPTATE